MYIYDSSTALVLCMVTGRFYHSFVRKARKYQSLYGAFANGNAINDTASREVAQF